MRKRKDSPPPDERAQALSPVISLRAPIDEGAQAPTLELNLRAVDQDMSSWMAGPPLVNALETGTLELSAQAQGAPTTTQGINAREAAAASAPPPKIRLFSKETRPFNYARLQEDEAPHLHTLSFKENARDKGEESAERARDEKDDASFEGTEQSLCPVVRWIRSWRSDGFVAQRRHAIISRSR